MKTEAEKLKSFLLDLDLVTKERMEKIEKKAEKGRESMESLLITEGVLDEEKLSRVKAYILGIPFISLEEEKIPSELLRVIPENVARAHGIVAFRKKEKNLEVAMTDPGNLEAIEIVKKTTGLNILPRLTTSAGLQNILRQYQDSLEAEFGEMLQKEDRDRIKIMGEEEKEKKEEDPQKAAEEMPVIKIVDILIKHAILQRASDIHIEPQEKEILVRYRIDGVLSDVMVLPSNIAPGVVARIKILSNLKMDEHRLPQDGRFKIEKDDFRYSLRVSILPTSYGEKVVMRLLPETTEAMDLKEIGLEKESLEKVKDALKKNSGMILVTGPTGSGKTTTLYSLLRILNTPGVNISTVEDPIEYQIPRINQTQVNPKIGLTFASGLRALVRQDPDVIMVGEVRDNETAKLAINAALTGHLVLSTLHTTNSAGAASRLVDMEVEPFLISSTLNVVIAQRLLRKLQYNREAYFLSEADIENLKKYCDVERLLSLFKKFGIAKENQSLKDVEFYRPKESKTSPEGYKGRVGTYEVLVISEKVRDLVVERASSGKIEEQAKKEGMVTMLEDGLIKAAQGITSIEEVLRVLIE